MKNIRANNQATFEYIQAALINIGYTPEKSQYPLTLQVQCSSEADLRLALQKYLDDNNFDFTKNWILISGNSVYSYNKIISELKRIKKRGVTKGISKYFYKFMSLNFTIAHYDINGWIDTYPKWFYVKRILDEATPPTWKADVMRILNDAKEI